MPLISFRKKGPITTATAGISLNCLIHAVLNDGFNGVTGNQGNLAFTKQLYRARVVVKHGKGVLNQDG